MEKKSGLLREIKKIKAKSYRKHRYSSSDSSISDPDSDSSLYSDIKREELINTTEWKEINKLDHVVTNNTKKK